MKRILSSDWLADPPCPLGISRVGPARKGPLFCHIINPLLTKLVRLRWLETGPVLFCVFLHREENKLGQYSATLTTRLVNIKCIFLAQDRI